MLPYDNKSEIQVVVDMPEGTTLEATAAVARELALEVREAPRGHRRAGLRRHLGPVQLQRPRAALLPALRPARRRPAGQPPARRTSASATATRSPRTSGTLLAPIAKRHGANVKVTEVPPGPPVLSTMVAEIYGPDLGEADRARAARCARIFEETPGVVDVDWLVEDPAPKVELVVDREKATRAGVTPEVVMRTLRVALDGAEAGLLRDENARAPRSRSSSASTATQRSSLDGLLPTAVHGGTGRLVPLARARHRRRDDARAVHLPQEPAAGDVRPRRDGGGRRGPGLRDPRHGQQGSRR